MPKLFVLVGVPGSGKSTWIKNQNWLDQCAIVSTDQYVEAHAKNLGKTYNEIFHDFMPQAVRLMVDDVLVARSRNQDIVWDQTSTTKLSRLKKISMLRSYYKIAVVFRTPERDELDRRLNNRPGKIIPAEVIDDMILQFEEPEKSEGFDEIWYASSSEIVDRDTVF